MLHRHAKATAEPGEFLLSALPVEMHLYPNLAEFLFVTKWPDDGKVRIPGTFTVFGNGVNLKVMIFDKAQALTAFLTIDPEGELLTAIEKALESTSTDWRPAKTWGKQK